MESRKQNCLRDFWQSKIILRCLKRINQSFNKSTTKEGSPRYPEYYPHAIYPSDRQWY
jgi:hypothetical protein